MDYRNLGSTGIKVSELCLGTMQFGWTANEETARKVLSEAYHKGINFIDTANIYSHWVEGNPGGVSEEIIGRWMKKLDIPRHSIVLATKVRGPMGEGVNDHGLSRTHIMQAVEDSLRRLGTDYIDLYQTHWFDEDTPIEETLSAFDDLIRQGKVRYIGCSNYPAWRLVEALWSSDRKGLASFVSLQPHYNLIQRDDFERELSEVSQAYGLGVVPYSPLAGGFLTGKYRRNEPIPAKSRGEVSQRIKGYFTAKNWKLLEKMEAVGLEKDGLTISQVALAWLLSNPTVTSPIIGPRSVNQLNDNLGAVGVRLTAEEKENLDKLTAWQ